MNCTSQVKPKQDQNISN